MPPYRMADVHGRFAGAYCVHLQSQRVLDPEKEYNTFLRNIYQTTRCHIRGDRGLGIRLRENMNSCVSVMPEKEIERKMTEERGRNKTRNETNKEKRQEMEGGIEEGKISCDAAIY